MQVGVVSTTLTELKWTTSAKLAFDFKRQGIYVD